jgi:glutaredoxin-related protein
MLTVYSKNNCPFCVQAKRLLESKSVPYQEINIENDPSARQMLLDKGLRSVPQIFKEQELIPGGFQGLSKQPADFFQQLQG